jgi:hypothetical protein
MRTEKSCPLPRTHNRLRQIHDLWHEALWAYADPDQFTTKLNACIQAARSVTFVLQKEHGKSDGFDTWYREWQGRMRNDSLMRWLVDARNTVEKEGDLDTQSQAVVSLAVGAYAEPLKKIEVPPLMSPSDVASVLNVENLDAETRQDAVLVVERRWAVNELPDSELLDVLGHCYGVLSQIVREGHERVGVRMQTFGGETHGGRHVRVEHPSGRLPCMVATHELRTAYWHLGVETLVELEETPVERDDAATQEAVERYGPALAGHRIHPDMPIQEQARAMHHIGRAILKIDHFHHALAWLHRGAEGVGQYQVDPADQQGKAVMIRRLAAAVDRLGANAVIFTTETWLARMVEPVDPRAKLRASERDDREEALNTYLLQRHGPNLSWLSRFTRGQNDEIELSDPVQEELREEYTIFQPILQVWKGWEDEGAPFEGA